MQSVHAATATQRACRRHYVSLYNSFILMCYFVLGIANATAPDHEDQEKSHSPTVCLSARQGNAMCCPL